jgi:ribonuclease PH
MGNTRVLCAATVEEKVPPFLEGAGRGWVTAEYAMLPASTTTRKERERSGKVDGRTQEIQRLVGRALRAVTDMAKLGPRTIRIDCDVLDADGGTRTAAITGAYVALADCVGRLAAEAGVSLETLKEPVAAVSVGLVDGKALLDLCYAEDSSADVDMNVVMTAGGKFVEVQGTAESTPFTSRELDALLKLAKAGVRRLVKLQEEALRLK